MGSVALKMIERSIVILTVRLSTGGHFEAGNPRPPTHFLTGLVFIVFVDIPEGTIVHWVDGHAGVISPPRRILLVTVTIQNVKFCWIARRELPIGGADRRMDCCA